MASKRVTSGKGSLKGLNPSSPKAAAIFAEAASAYTAKATKTQKTAQAALIREGILTPTGRLKRLYATAKG